MEAALSKNSVAACQLKGELPLIFNYFLNIHLDGHQTLKINLLVLLFEI